jgi:bla regulator protein BlaR1
MIVSVLINGLWQGAAIVAITYALCLGVPKRNAATRYALWFTALLTLAIVPVITALPIGAPHLFGAASQRIATSYRISLIPTNDFAQQAGVWFGQVAPWLLTAWLLGVTVNLARLAASFVRIRRIRRSARPLAGAADLYVSDELSVPIVAGIFAPAIVVPSAVLTRVSEDDLRRIVTHERAHVSRNDSLLNLVQRLIEAFLFFNPWVHVAGNQVSQEREIACDDWVVAKIGRADRYAVCLAALARDVRRQTAPLLTPSAFGSRHTLVSRIERLSSTEPRGLAVNSFALGGTVVLFIVASFLLTAVSPAFAISPAGGDLSGFSQGAAMLAATCANPNVGALVRNAAMPQLPHGVKTSGTAEVTVTISPSGHVTGISILRSSGNAAIDKAVINAARQSTYSPKIENCTPVVGTYVFRVDYAPNP